MLYYQAGAINLLNDTTSAWLNAVLGASTTLQNSQCSLNVGTSTETINGNTLTLNLAIAFSSGYMGTQNVYLYAADVSGSSSGWQPLGTWTVPSVGIYVTINQELSNNLHGALANTDVCGVPGRCYAFSLASPPASYALNQAWTMTPNAPCSPDPATGFTTVSIGGLGPLPMYAAVNGAVVPIPAGGTPGVPCLPNIPIDLRVMLQSGSGLPDSVLVK
jgi:hypothetical protein